MMQKEEQQWELCVQLEMGHLATHKACVHTKEAVEEGVDGRVDFVAYLGRKGHQNYEVSLHDLGPPDAAACWVAEGACPDAASFLGVVLEACLVEIQMAFLDAVAHLDSEAYLDAVACLDGVHYEAFQSLIQNSDASLVAVLLLCQHEAALHH
jgi:hypothetical protein